VAYLVEEELKIRKKKESYSGTFTPITHYFGYEGRSGHPSEFDCSLASTMGYTAGVLIQHRLTGLAVSVTHVTLPTKKWRCCGVPILGMISDQPKSTLMLGVKSDNVDTSGSPF
jgi:6-phosphofructokinase